MGSKWQVSGTAGLHEIGEVMWMQMNSVGRHVCSAAHVAREWSRLRIVMVLRPGSARRTLTI